MKTAVKWCYLGVTHELIATLVTIQNLYNINPASIPASGGAVRDKLTAPDPYLNIYWQLMAGGAGRISFL